jgi:hypothetical protein
LIPGQAFAIGTRANDKSEEVEWRPLNCAA